jgi:uncharacterized membrane protein YidH (DUF202 family)
MSDREPGLQTERTALAWVRTAAVALVTSILLVRHGLDAHQPVFLLSAAATATLAAAALRLRRHRLRADRSRTALPARAVLAFAGLVTVCGLTATAGLLWSTG